MKWRAWLPLLAGLSLAAPARADLAGGLAALRRGDWAEAEQQLRAVPPADRPAASLALAELKQLTGDYATALQLARPLAQRPPTAPLRNEALVRMAEIEWETGQHDAAIQHLRMALAANGDYPLARALLAIAYHETGKTDDARRLFQSLVADHAARKVGRRRAEELTAVALACRYLEQWQDANSLFQEAVGADPHYLRANLEWADLFLLKYNPAGALESLQEVVKINPNHPRALVALAHLALEQGNQVTRAAELLESALQQNPNFPEAFVVQARLALDNAEFAAAEAAAQRALAVNPRHLRAIVVLAASRFLQDDRAGYDAWRAKAFQINPRYADFYPQVAEFAERHHRYAECVELHRQALAIDATHPAALYGLGVAYLRTNREAEGLAALQKAWDRDPFNVRNFNLLNLFEEIIPQEYETVVRGPFRFRWNKREAPAIGGAVEALMRRAWQTFVAKYGFTPTEPLTLELYTARDHFSVRTLGLPDLGAQGVCFGAMVTAISPAVGEANWEQVLWHETAHVFHLQLSRNRVSRWFTEGLAEYETNVARPEWRREHDRTLYLALRRGDLWSIRDLNAAFTRPGRPGGVVLAYHQSSLVIHYLVEKYGFAKIVAALRLYGQGQGDEAVLRTITGEGIAAVDAGFRAWLRETRLAHFERGLVLDYEGLARQREALEKRAATDATADALAELAAACYGSEDFAAAIAAARRALAADPQHLLARYLLGLALVRSGDLDAAREPLQAVLAAGRDGYELRLALARLARAAGDPKAFEEHLQAAKRWDPDQTTPARELAELYEMQGRADEALAELAQICRIEEHSLAAAMTLVRKCLTLGKPEKLLDYAPIALAIHPAEPFVLQQYGAALVRASRYREALPVLEAAVAVAAKKSEVRGLLALAYLETGDRDRARAAAEATLAEDPGNPEARQVLRRLDGG